MMPRQAGAATPTPQEQLQEALQRIHAGRPMEAEAQLETVLAREPRNPDALHLLGIVHYQAGRHERALALVSAALAVAGRSPLYWNTLGSTQRALGRLAEAADSYRRAIALAPDFAQAQVNHGLTLHALGRTAEAEAAYRRGIALVPNDGRAHAHLGAALFDLGRHAEAAESFRRALDLGPAEPALRVLLARALMRDGRHEAAADVLAKALEINPGDAAAEALLHECRAIVCDWSAFDTVAPFYRRKIAEGRLPLAGEALVPAAIPGLTRADQLAFARAVAARIAGRAQAPPRDFGRAPKARLRIGYLSGNFREHPTARLAAAMIELHDRSGFEICGYGTGADDGSAPRARLLAAFDRFTDLHAESAAAAAERIAADRIDILLALDGYGAGAAPHVLALRAAPVQASLLGYPATMGAPFIDYIIADPFVLPPAHAADYAEAPAWLPDCVLPHDGERAAAPAPSRAACGLPEGAFVFACFAGSAGITPAVFEAWTSLLAAVPGSVLWLRDGNAGATRNLRAAAAQRGLDERLVFAPEAEHAAHRARLVLADLCLDTFPHNASSAAVEALAAGVPVVACVGDTFAARLGGSALAAAGLPELITGSLEEYRELAQRLAGDPAVLRDLRARLAAARATAPLFDTRRHVRHLEALYRRMWERFAAGEPPAAIGAR